jgi:uncharacterized protein
MPSRRNLAIAKEFAGKVSKEYPDAKIILFGSRATEDYLEESDFDFIIVSEKFQGTNFFERIEQLYAFWNEKQSIEPLCYTPQEFEQKKKQTGIVQEAVRTGIQII